MLKGRIEVAIQLAPSMAGRGKPVLSAAFSPLTLINADALVVVYLPDNGRSDREPELGQ